MNRLKIALISVEAGRVAESVYQGVQQELFREKHKVCIDTFVTMSCRSAPIEKVVKNVLSLGYDLIVPVGTAVTKGVKQVTRERAPAIPVIPCVLTRPVERGVVKALESSGSNIVCVASKPLKHLLLAKVVLVLRPLAKRILIPYRSQGLNGQASEEVKKMQKFFELRGRKVSLFRLKGEQVPLEINHAMKGIDLIVTPEGCLLARDVSAIKACAKSMGVEILVDGVEAIKNGFFLGLVVDYIRIGEYVGKYIREILLKGKKPGELPSLELKNLRSISHTDPKMAKGGCILTEELICLTDRLIKECDDETILDEIMMFSSLRENNAESTVQLLEQLIKDVREWTMEQKWFQEHPDDIEIVEDYIKRLVEHELLEKQYVSGGKALEQLRAEMKAKGVHRTTYAIQEAASLEEARGLQAPFGRPDENVELIGFVVEPLNPAVLVATCAQYMKRCARVFFPITLEEEELPDDFAAYKKRVEQACRDMKVVVRWVAQQDTKRILGKLTSERALVASIPRLTAKGTTEELAALCYHQDIMYCGAHTRAMGSMPLSVGVRCELMKRYHAGLLDDCKTERDKNVTRVFVPAMHAYAFSYNEQRLQELQGGKIDKKYTTLLSYERKRILSDEP